MRIRLILFITVLIIEFICLLSCKHKQENNLTTNEDIIPIDTTLTELPYIKDSTEVFLYCESMPTFPGGEKLLIEYLKKNTNYPQSAIKDSLEGRVILRCVIKANGFTDNIEVIRGIRDDLDNECIKVLKMMPKWQPGRQWNKPVPVYYIIPFRFVLNKNSTAGGIQIYPRKEQLISKIKLTVYPNPAKEFIIIRLDELPIDTEYNIISLNGRLLKKGIVNDFEQQLDMQDFADGIYIIALSTNGSLVCSQKFIIKK